MTPEDLFDLAGDVLVHRIRVSYEASAAGHTGRAGAGVDPRKSRVGLMSEKRPLESRLTELLSRLKLHL